MRFFLQPGKVIEYPDTATELLNRIIADCKDNLRTAWMYFETYYDEGGNKIEHPILGKLALIADKLKGMSAGEVVELINENIEQAGTAHTLS